MTLIEKLKECWKDPVWSKVIATAITATLGFILAFIYSLATHIVDKISFTDAFKVVIAYLKSTIILQLWQILVMSFSVSIFVTKPIVEFLREIYKKTFYSNTPNKNSLPPLPMNENAIFSYRMAKAFPGQRGLQWYNSPKVAIKRLQILFENPLTYKGTITNSTVNPIWWFRGSSSMYINSFKKLNSTSILMNHEQLKIKRIAAYHGHSPYRDFVYIETHGENQTGLYNISVEAISNGIKEMGYYWEEYGILNILKFWNKNIRREEYDDGGTVIANTVIDASKAELRIRYLTDYNIIVTSNDSPYNTTRFAEEFENYLNGILKKEASFDDFMSFLEKLPRREKY